MMQNSQNSGNRGILEGMELHREDYTDRDSAQKSDRLIRSRLSEGIDALMGSVEWLKTDLLRKGNQKHLEELEDLSEALEAVSRRMEGDRDLPPPSGQEGENERSYGELFEAHKELVSQFGKIQKEVNKITAEGVVPGTEDIERIRRLVRHMGETAKNY